MKCDFSVDAYGNYFSKQAVIYLGDHNSICCIVHSTLELLRRWEDLHYQRPLPKCYIKPDSKL